MDKTAQISTRIKTSQFSNYHKNIKIINIKTSSIIKGQIERNFFYQVASPTWAWQGVAYVRIFKKGSLIQ